MLEQRDIIAWRDHAPWVDDTQVEQDLLITRAMVAIFADRFLSEQVAMRGGTMLHKLHIAPATRYSEDIDLVAVGERPEGHIRRALLRILNPIMGGAPRTNVWASLKLAVRNAAQASRVLRLEWTYQPTNHHPATMNLKVEVNVTERTPLYAPVRVPFDPPLPTHLRPSGAQAVEAATYDIDEMLGTKMRALRQRDKGRDLYDIAAAWKRGTAPGHPYPVDPARTVAAFVHYMKEEGSLATRADYEGDLLRKARLKSFRADLEDVLAHGETHDVDESIEILRTHFLPHLS